MIVSPAHPLAYFCAEFGLQPELPLYAGGLGILAGDTLKAASDAEYPLVGVGLLYRGGYSIQEIDPSGWQTESNFCIDPLVCGLEHVYLPNEDQPLFVKVHLTKQDVWARVWKKTMGSVVLYLLDTDTDQNEPKERDITNELYQGSEEDLVKQQMILGIGGVKLLKALDIEPALYHVNEGRPAFLYWQLIRQYMDHGAVSYAEAVEKAKSMIVYTNHTLVRAGNQSYDTDLLEQYATYYANKMDVSIDDLLKPGIEETSNKFSITQFALNTSRKASSVSQPHFELSHGQWQGFTWVNVTNGVHMPTWQDEEIRLADKTNDSLWYVHQQKKQELAAFVQQKTGYGYDPNRLVLGWARRVVGYKRLLALFEDLPRFKAILSSSERPVQLLVAGKAHPKDTASKDMLKQVISYMQHELSGYALFVPNYDMSVSKLLVKGVDVWLNSPILGQEACGTSGMKAIANGVLQFTVEDGWAAEVNWNGIGWTIDNNHVADTFYTGLEQNLVPEFYDRDANGVPQAWLERMKKSITLSEQYSAARMLKEYQTLLYC
jgi:glycogen phosphorylase